MDVSCSDKSSKNSEEQGTFVAAGAFATTHWSVVIEAQGESPAAQEALEKLCRT